MPRSSPTSTELPAAHSRLLSRVLTASVAAFVFFLVVPAFQPVPRLPWYEGVLLETVSRLQHGGSAYSGLGNGSLVPAEAPYFPATIFITWLCSSLLPLGDYWPRILGTMGTLVFLVEGWITAARLSGSRWAAGILTTLGFAFLLAAVERFQAQSFFPDYLLGACALLAANVVARAARAEFSRARFGALCALLFLVGTLKQSGFAVFAGLGVFAMWPGTAFPRPARVRLLAALTLAGLAVLAAICLTPHCWEATITAMSGHPIMRTAIGMPVYVGAALVALAVIGLAFVLPSKLDPTGRALAQQVVALYIPLSIIQTLSACKAGGGAYDFLVPALLGLPVLVAGFLWFFRKRRLTLPLVVLGLGSALISLRTGVRDLIQIPAAWAQFREASTYLERFRGQRALFNVYSARLVRSAGLEPRTDIHTLTHYALSGLKSVRVLEAIRRREYEVVVGIQPEVFDQTVGDPFFRSAVMQEYGTALRQNYRPVEESALPALLRRRLYVPIDAQ